ncbi:hypothetical protein CULT_510023 [[Clostridium] ultunense Esp]|nr:hypothetical protein CULT_510023 [[Clostridium] ultunense Esp]
MEIDRITQGGVRPVTPVTPGKRVSPGMAEDVYMINGMKDQDRGSENLGLDAKAARERGTLTPEEAKKAVEGFNAILKPTQSHVKFLYHEKMGEYYVQIIDDNTNEVIREIPPKKLLDMVASIWEQIGLIVDEKV